MKRIGLLLFTVLYFSFSAFGMYKVEDVSSLFNSNEEAISATNYLDLIRIVCENTRQTILNVGQMMRVVKANAENKKTDTPIPAQEKKSQAQLTLAPQYKLSEIKNFSDISQQSFKSLSYNIALGALSKIPLLFMFCIFLFLYRLKLHRSRARGALAIIVNFLEKMNPVLRNQSGVFLFIKNTLERCSNV